MKNGVFIYDPTTKDELGKVRGTGRYLQILRENFKDEFSFVSEPKNIPFESIFINPFFDFLQSPLVTKRIAKKQIAVIHDLIPLKYPSHFPLGIRGKLNVFLNKLTLKNYDLIITVSETSKKDIVNILDIKEDKIRVIYSTIPKLFTFSTNSVTQSMVNISGYCIYVGDATWNKNLVNLAKAIKLNDIPCIFVGKIFDKHLTLDVERSTSMKHPWQQELLEFYQEIKDDKRFVLAGYVNDEELIGLYKNAELNILVSRDEGFGFSYVEAGFLGCPSLLSDISVFHEISAEAALFTDPNDPHNIAKQMQTLYNDDALRAQLSTKSKERANIFTPEKFQESWKMIIDF
jgi:glycosyltransferase involved in cell wall biosynthesis